MGDGEGLPRPLSPIPYHPAPITQEGSVLALKVYYDSDADLGVLEGKKIAVIGYGSQGHAHALNLHESGLDVVVGLYEGSSSKAKAEAEGLTVMNTPEAARAAD